MRPAEQGGGIAPGNLSRDHYLGGAVIADQPKSGFRAGIDTVLLAAAVPARAGQSVLELGCGAGVASLCLGARVGGLSLTGVELQTDYAALARANAALNDQMMQVVAADLTRLPAGLRALTFDHVIANPPFFPRQATRDGADPGRDKARAADTPLATWADVALRRLVPGGRVTMILRVERVPDLLVALDGRAGAIALQPLAPRAGRAAKLALISARKGSRAPFALAPPVVLHRGATHDHDGEDYSDAIQAVLRKGAAFPWGVDLN